MYHKINKKSLAQKQLWIERKRNQCCLAELWNSLFWKYNHQRYCWRLEDFKNLDKFNQEFEDAREFLSDLFKGVETNQIWTQHLKSIKSTGILKYVHKLHLARKIATRVEEGSYEYWLQKVKV